MTASQPSDVRAKTKSEASFDSARVKVIEGPESTTVVYKWMTHNKWVVMVFIWIVLEVQLLIIYSAIVRPHKFYAINYPGYVIMALLFAYFVAIPIFNRTTTIITGDIISIRRGPIICPWPGNITRSINDIREFSYARQRTVIVDGSVMYYISVIFAGGRQVSIFTMIDEEGAAMALTNRLQKLVRRKQLAQGLPTSDCVRISEGRTFPPDRTQRLKIMASIPAILVVLGIAVAAVE